MLWNTLRGCVKIQVTGLSLERLINAIAEKGLRLYNVERQGPKCLTAWIDAASYVELAPLFRQLHCRTKVLQKQGLPFALRLWRDRWMLALGGLVCVAALFFLSHRLWDIRILGNASIPTDRVLASVTKQVTIGMPIDKIDLNALKSFVERSDPRIAWVGAHKNGSRLTIHIVEGDLIEKAENDNTPAHIVATKDAIISEITVLRGYAPVLEGQHIKEGDILISGAMPANQEMGERYLCARGEVYGRLLYYGDALVKRESATSSRSGRVEDAYSLRLALQSIEIDSEFENYEAEEGQRIGVDYLFLPLELIRERHFETKLVTTELNDAQMHDLAQKISLQKARDQLPKEAEIVSEETSFSQTEEGLHAVSVIETRENIGAAIHFVPPAATPEPSESALALAQGG